MNNQEKRALEIYTTLILQQIRKNNSNALKDIRAFFYGLNFKQTYNPELLYSVCIENIEILEKIPTHYEVLLCLNIKTDNLEFKASNFKGLYNKSLTTLTRRKAAFSGLRVQLFPKIKNDLFHQNLLTFYKELNIIGKKLPVKSRRKLWNRAY